MAHTAALMPRPPYAALIFDCDGTLVDTLPTHYRALVETLAPYGITVDREWFLARAGTSIHDLLAELRASEADGFDLTTVLVERERHFARSIISLVEISAVADIARSHHGRMPLAVASGGRRALVEAALRVTGLYPLFDVVVTFDDVRQGKPAPDLFLLAATRLGVSAGACVVYEDSDEGILAAQRAGMRCIDVRPALSLGSSTAVAADGRPFL